MKCLMPTGLARRGIALALLIALGGESLAEKEALAEKPVARRTIGTIERYDPAFDKLVPRDARIEVLGEGFEWSEGPVWVPARRALLFSDIPRNVIMQWKSGDGVSLFRRAVGYTGSEPFKGSEPGTNGLILDRQGRLVMCCHGDRCIKRLEKDGTLTVLADRFEGKRFNSPNDLIYHSNGDLYFTDPPYGLPKRGDDPNRELDYCGVYRLSPQGKVTLLTRDMTRPNGIGLSPDEKTLYVAQSDPQAAIWLAFPIGSDGMLGKPKQLYDATRWVGKRPGLPDGMVIDREGNLWATGPGGVFVFNPSGKLLGRISTGEKTANCTFGEDGSTLFLTADMYLCRLRTTARGIGR